MKSVSYWVVMIMMAVVSIAGIIVGGVVLIGGDLMVGALILGLGLLFWVVFKMMEKGIDNGDPREKLLNDGESKMRKMVGVWEAEKVDEVFKRFIIFLEDRNVKYFKTEGVGFSLALTEEEASILFHIVNILKEEHMMGGPSEDGRHKVLISEEEFKRFRRWGLYYMAYRQVKKDGPHA